MSEDKTSEFLRTVESSARSILRKNNERNQQSNTTSLENEALDSNNGSTVHPKLKASPFYNAWEGWDKSRQKEMAAEDGLDVATEHCIRSSIPSRTMGQGKGKGRSSLARKAMEKQKAASDGLILDSSALRKRFRCDERLVHDNQRDGDCNEALESTDGEESEHPIQALLSQHVASMTARVHQMTKKNLSTMSSIVSDTHKKALEKERLQALPSIDKEVMHDGCSDHPLREGRDDKQVEACDLLPDDAKEYRGTNQPFDDASYEVSKPILKESNRVIPSLTPESWPLVVLEEIVNPIGNATSYLSIHRIQTTTGEGPSQTHCWILDFYNHKYQSEKRYILYDDEMASLITSMPNVESDNRCDEDEQSDDGVLVHEESTSRTIHGTSFNGNCVVRIQKSGMKLTATISFSLEQSELHETTIELKLCLPIYEIIAGLNLHHLCKTFDARFWLSGDNGDRVWKKLVSQIEVVMHKRVSKNGQLKMSTHILGVALTDSNFVS